MVGFLKHLGGGCGPESIVAIMHFSRVDIRVEVTIPGGVEAYAINGLSPFDVNGNVKKLPIKEEYWTETYVSAVLRSLHYSDDLTYRLDGLRYFNIIPDIDSEVRFFEAVEQLFWKGYLLGTETDLQFANNVHNYLSDGVMKYLSNSGHYHSGINVFAKHILFTCEICIVSVILNLFLDITRRNRS
ncbi:bud site selection protein [Entomophthora muscae]|uniref:Bud site selection protein n=1 Tax=Entomophthora muscae TaxID=34485 RepID=A0ACC2SXB3_9FUNG|nr:bud site selection protein [Entomophthora muscae]